MSKSEDKKTPREAVLFAGFFRPAAPAPMSWGDKSSLSAATRAAEMSAAVPPAPPPSRATILVPTSHDAVLFGISHRSRRCRSRGPRRHRQIETRLRCSASQQPSAPPGGEAFSGERGAEWAGWECRFSATDGRPKPVPEDYVPESLREWDVGVLGFETLTSEQLRRQKGQGEEGNTDEDTGRCGGVLYRKRGRVYPETGCAVDNLTLEEDTFKSPLEGDGVFVASFDSPGTLLSLSGWGHVLAKKAEDSKSLQLEVGILVAGVQFSDPSLSDSDASEAEKEEWSRARVELELRVDGGKIRGSGGGGGGGGENGGESAQQQDAAAVVLGPTVTVTRERRYRDTFDDGLLYQGGGLDAQKLRRVLRSKCFAESDSPPAPEDLAGSWTYRAGHWQPFRGSTAAAAIGDAEDVFGDRDARCDGVETLLLLPGDVTVRSGPWSSDGALGDWVGPAAPVAPAASEGPLSQICEDGSPLWAVEVGWFLGRDGADGDSDAHRGKRITVTTVLDAGTLTPLGGWKGEEERRET